MGTIEEQIKKEAAAAKAVVGIGVFGFKVWVTFLLIGVMIMSLILLFTEQWFNGLLVGIASGAVLFFLKKRWKKSTVK